MSTKAILAIVALVSFLAVAHAGQFVINPCSKESHLSPSISLSSPNFTDGESRPILRKGEKYTLTLNWQAATSTGALTTKVAALILGLEAPWNAIDPRTCNFLIEGECPFVAGQSYVYENTIEVNPSYPTTNLIILWRVRLPDNRNEVCFELPAQIVN